MQYSEFVRKLKDPKELPESGNLENSMIRGKERKSRAEQVIVKSIIVGMLVCFVYMIYLYSKVVLVCSC